MAQRRLLGEAQAVLDAEIVHIDGDRRVGAEVGRLEGSLRRTCPATSTIRGPCERRLEALEQIVARARKTIDADQDLEQGAPVGQRAS